jgi:hypothetical protein
VLERPRTEEEDELEVPFTLVGGGRVGDHARVVALSSAGALCGAKSGHELVEQGRILQADTHGFEERVSTF